MIHRINRLGSAFQRKYPGFQLGLITGGWILLLLCLWLALGGLDDRWSPGIFVGRFHILVVHLPIGLLAGVLLLLGNCFFNPNVRTPRIVPGRRGCNYLAVELEPKQTTEPD